MLRVAILGLTLTLAAGLSYGAPAPAAAPPADAPAAVDLAKFIPEDAFLAARLRMDKLVASDLWKKLVGAEDAMLHPAIQEFPLSVDLEKDIKEAVLTLSLEMADYGPKDPLFVCGLRLAKPVDPATFYKKGKAEKIILPDLDKSIQAYRVDARTFYAFVDPQTVILSESPVQMTAALTAGTSKEPAKDAFFGKALAQPGEAALGARRPQVFVDWFKKEMEKERARGPMGGGRMSEMTWFGSFGITLLSEFQTAQLSLDTSRQDDALRITANFETENGAAFIGSGLALAEPTLRLIAADLQQMMGQRRGPGPGAAVPPPAAAPAAPGKAADEPPLFKSVFQGKEVRLTVTRAGLEKIASVFMGGFFMAARFEGPPPPPVMMMAQPAMAAPRPMP